MTKGISALLLVLVLVSVTVSPASVQDEATIQVAGHWDQTRHPNAVDEGSACAVAGPLDFPRQVIIKDQTDTIVAAWAITGTWEFPEGREFLACTWDMAIPVPTNATFFTLYLDEQRLITLDASSLPAEPISFVIPSNPKD